MITEEYIQKVKQCLEEKAFSAAKLWLDNTLQTEDIRSLQKEKARFNGTLESHNHNLYFTLYDCLHLYLWSAIDGWCNGLKTSDTYHLQKRQETVEACIIGLHLSKDNAIVQQISKEQSERVAWTRRLIDLPAHSPNHRYLLKLSLCYNYLQNQQIDKPYTREQLDYWENIILTLTVVYYNLTMPARRCPNPDLDRIVISSSNML